MLNTKLSPCANLLYHWLLIHKNDAKTSPFDLVAFQIWTGEFLTKTAPKNEVLVAIYVLKNLNLITAENQLLYINPQYTAKNNYIYQLPTYYLLGKRTKKRNHYLWGLFTLVAFFCLWGGSLWFVLKTNTEVVPLSPFSVLGENNDNY